ncbi:flagellar biosynthesis protein FlgJ [Erythrobacter sp. WG]|uniref:flagellar biosynthesis protein FlgJ n=1 Tax=Erythrobacter sp. WG TaxID=2985510 RepID=UPI0022717641|nr:flagellar biosynthesis protein FlgJ [Erythrobacter sp. WG]MCX9148603.1 flagellar biosynthesis protein FlgJ [Erythrobacter sp. WG]
MTGPVPPSGPVAPRSAVRSTPSLSSERTALQSDLRKAAEGFEAIMVRKLLATARATSFAEETPLTGGGLKQFETMRDEHVADLVAKSGALGFARSIEARLAQYLPGQGDS